MKTSYQFEHTIETDRFYLKSITPKVIHHFFNTLEKNEIIEVFGFGEEGFDNYKELHEKGIETRDISLFFFIIIEKLRNITIGNCGFHTWNKKHQKAEIFYNLHDDFYKQKGCMSEVLPNVLNFGFTNLQLHRIQALVADYNIPSVKLLLKNGFIKEGILREDYLVDGKFEDSDCYSLLKSEWKKLNNLS